MSCSYCFKPDAHYDENAERIQELAHVLSSNNVRKVTIGGGEPLLVKNLDNALRILKKEDIYVSLHTNGARLNNNRVSQLSELVNDIALPIDSISESVQQELRGEKSVSVFKKLTELVDKILSKGMKIGYHTVFTAINHQDILEIYDFIKQKDFDYWRIYEFNDDLARTRFLLVKPRNEAEKQRIIQVITKIEQLSRLGTPEKGYTDTLFANFLLMEQHMKKHKDKRIQFVGIRDYSRPNYAFLDNSGDVSFYSWFSYRERRVIGNILRDGFSFVKQKFQELEEKGWEFDDKGEDEFINALYDRPLWARAWDGNYDFEELEEMNGQYYDSFNHLVELYNEREKQLETRPY